MGEVDTGMELLFHVHQYIYIYIYIYTHMCVYIYIYIYTSVRRLDSDSLPPQDEMQSWRDEFLLHIETYLIVASIVCVLDIVAE